MPIGRLRLRHLLTALGPLLASLVWVGPARGEQAPVAPECADVVFVGARASGEARAPFDGMGAAVDLMAGVLRVRLAAAGLTMHAEAVAYPAEPTSDLYLFWRGRIRSYFRSIDAGVRAAITLADRAVRACPDVSLVLGGYSQGAMAVHQAERRMAVAGDPALGHIAGTLLVGDGDRVFGTRARRFGTASAEAVGIRTYVLPGDGHDVALPEGTADICDAGDLICDFGIRELGGLAAIRRAIGVHAAYAPRHGTGRYSPLLGAAARWVARRVIRMRVPAAVVRPGPTLIDAGIGATFTRWAAATGQPVDVEDHVPAGLPRYACAVVLLPGDVSERETARLGAYLRAGGTVVAVGERADGGRFSRADAALAALAARLGVGLALADAAVDPGGAVTSRISDDPLTAGVASLGYDWAATIDVAGAGRPLAQTADGTGTLIAAAAVGAGTFVLAGDSNLVTDDDVGGYDDHDNGRLVRDLCG
jgi:cutinase